MNLRTRLILAFFVTSVVPLSAVTFYSYTSSRQAFENAVEAEARFVAREMGQRMDTVTASLEQRMDQLWDVPMGANTAATRKPASLRDTDADEVEAPAELDALLGNAATFLERIEIVPTAAPAPPESPVPPRHAGSSRRDQHRKIFIDVSRWMKAKRPGSTADARTDVDPAAWVGTMQEVLAAGLDLGLKGAIAGIKQGAEELKRRVEEQRRDQAAIKARTEERQRAVRQRQLAFMVHRQGREVGQIQATLNMNRILAGVLSTPRRERGEIPFAIDGTGLHTQNGGDASVLRGLGVDRRKSSGVWRTADWLIVARDDPSGVTFGIAHPLGESLQEIRRASVRSLAIGLLFITVALVGIVPLSNRMTRSLSALTDGVRRIARGDFTARVPVKSTDEFGLLGRAFNQMAEDIEAHQKVMVDQERLKRELELCRQIQTEMLPRESLRLGLTEVKGVSIPAREVGGDFFNYFMMPGGEIALLVGDVSGKGVSAALLMANVQATLRARLPLEPDLAKLIAAVDSDIEKTTPRGVYFTLFVGILDSTTKVLRYLNAGHNPQFVIRAAGGLERLGSTGLPVGLFAGHGYTERQIALADDDLLFFYTDGAVEVENEAGEMFGAERLEQLLLREHASGIDAVLDRVEQEIRAHRGNAEPFDDATMMALRVSASPAGEPA